MRKSKIWLIPKEELQEIINNSSTNVEVLEHLGYNGHNGNHRTLKQRIKFDNIDMKILEKNRMEWKNNHLNKIKKEIPLNNILVENSKYNRRHLKRKLLDECLLINKCSVCNISEWNGKPISLQIDHINGINNDNRIENLRLLCPNCHSQTETFSGKNNKQIYTCDCCGGIKNNKNSKKCIKCSQKKQKRKVENRPEIEILENLVKDIGYCATGRKYGVSDNTIRKWLKIDSKK